MVDNLKDAIIIQISRQQFAHRRQIRLPNIN